MKKTVLLYLLSILSLNVLLNKALSAQPNESSEKGFYELKENFDRLNSGISHPFFNTDQYRSGSLVLNGEKLRELMNFCINLIQSE